MVAGIKNNGKYQNKSTFWLALLIQRETKLAYM